MASFVASSYARVPDGSVQGFPSWSDESITGTYYVSFIVPASTKSTQYNYPDLVGKDVQIVTYPVNWTSSEYSRTFSTPHVAGFDSASGSLYVERASDDLTLQCDTVVVLFSSGKQADSTGEYGIKITDGNGVSVIERSFSNLVIEEVISISADSPDYKGSSHTYSYHNDTYRLYDLPTWIRISNDRLYVKFDKQYIRPPVLAVYSHSHWAFVTMHLDNSSGRYSGATFYLPTGLNSYPDDFKVAVLGPLDTTYRQAVYSPSRYTTNYSSASATHNVLTTTDELYNRPGVHVQTEEGNTVFNSRFAPAGDIHYAGDVLAVGKALSPNAQTTTDIGVGQGLSVPTIPGESINQSVSVPYIVVSGYNSLGYKESSANWKKKKKKAGVTYKTIYYATGGVSTQVVCLRSVAGNYRQVGVYSHTYYNTADRKTKTEKTWKSWIGAFLVAGLFGVSLIGAFGAGYIIFSRPTREVLKVPGGNMSNLASSGLPKVYTIQLKLPLMGVTNIVPYGTINAEDIPPPASTDTITVPDVGDPVVLDPEEEVDVSEASIGELPFMWIRYINPPSEVRMYEIQDEILAWCVTNNLIPDVDPDERGPLFDALDKNVREEVMYRWMSIYYGLSYVYYNDEGVRVEIRSEDVSSFESGSTTFWGVILDSHGGSKVLMRSLFNTVSDFLNYYCSLMHEIVEVVEPEPVDPEDDEDGDEPAPVEPEFITVNRFLNFDEDTQRQVTSTDSRVVEFWQQIYAELRTGPMTDLNNVGSNERKQVFDAMLTIACSTELPLASAGVNTPTEWYPIHVNPETVYGVSDSPYFSYYTGDDTKPYTYCWELAEDQQGKVPAEDPELDIELNPEDPEDDFPED